MIDKIIDDVARLKLVIDDVARLKLVIDELETLVRNKEHIYNRIMEDKNRAIKEATVIINEFAWTTNEEHSRHCQLWLEKYGHALA